MHNGTPIETAGVVSRPEKSEVVKVVGCKRCNLLESVQLQNRLQNINGSSIRNFL
jgi:hypothetical protein